MKNKFGVTLIDDFEIYQALADEFNVEPQEIIQIDLNRCGIFLKNGEVRENYRVRFKGQIYGDYESWYALPVMSQDDTYFSSDGECLFYKNIPIGELKSELMLDTCENSYQRGPTLLNLNSRSRSNCGGCKACIHNYHKFYDESVIKDKHSLVTRDDLEQFFDFKKIDASKLAQIAVVTGLFGSEENVVEHIKLIKDVASERGFKGELMYFGCEVNSEDALKELSNLGNFSIVYAIDNFTNRNIVLAKKKSLITLDFAKNTLDSAKEKGIKTNISYIDGLDPLERLKSGFEYIADSLTDFPVVNVFQMQTSEQSKILTKEATDLSYFLKSRIELERIFKDTGLRPKRWANYRPLWYKTFDHEEMPNNSYGQLEEV